MGGHTDDGKSTESSSLTDPKYQNLALGLFRTIDRGVTYFRENVVLPRQSKNKEKFYHRQFRRVPTADQCDFQDHVCIYEADQQFVRDKMVDSNIVKILRQRKIECLAWEGPDGDYKCRQIIQEYEDAATNWFIKYGDMKTYKSSVEAYMKQKHRLIWERRNPDKKLH
ncbi:NADH dehydrogenase [ubiquinone] 1 beta subcomplex subunit 10 [Biomphalaria glabrata]|uniref:NADH dehydrogenase [ubiquinone] 1 beta subcomplex subunit 10 n=1 Tax=Biomphalaria glabrata TaxID=6526 RepID=A0A2C9JFI5_BIOGL|nr:NADH dehydrogenase [ubiquinone] 1 beta subcomplex subunit 10-like [Biomphalaria glabrata]KAI8766219.1 NADH dehydrogenase [ubiquinone] 1 beta subcomplex subunit 10-like [Biomphalaria glabrata]KAI8794002.1 NADH dehydrogenase [ubiquinone] 1 beta subcomplex subunit 10 [Biomphalaria glabrata]